MKRADVDVAVVGAGAAGLMAAIQAGRASRGARTVVALDSAKHLGAKILVAGGGRCNVTHHEVGERDFAGSTRPAIRKVLGRFPVRETIRFFDELGVALKREETGKLFPVSDRARSVLDALERAARDAGVVLRHPFRVESIERAGDEGFVLRAAEGSVAARRVVLATGGKSLPKSGSDGRGYDLARALGHTTTERIFPALVPLVLEDGCFVRGLSGLSADVAVEVRAKSGRRLARAAGPLLCTHFGLSGPVVLDVSRHLLAASFDDPEAHLTVAWLIDAEPPSARALAGWLRTRLPERLATALLAEAGVSGSSPWDRLSAVERRRVAETLGAWRAPVTGDQGFAKAEVTAGGVPLSEVRLDTLESRRTPGLHLCGEILDVDGKIGGFNFQWAWASGFVAGRAAAG